VRVTNIGASPLDLSGAHFEATDAVAAAALSVASTAERLLPGASRDLPLRFSPSTTGARDAVLSVLSDDPDQPEVSVPVTTSAFDAGHILDVFHQPPEAIDVLWVIDNSGSMAQEKDRITAQIDTFIGWFDKLALDYHMGVITTDVVNPIFRGQLVGDPPFVTPRTPDAAGVLAAAIQFDGIEMGNESGLEAMEWALSEPLRSGANAGFYRPDARLAVIFVTDEPEQSGLPAAHYITFLDTLKSDPRDIFIASVVGDRDTGCRVSCGPTPQTADPGNAYLDVTEAFRGFEASICTCELAPALERMGLEATEYARTYPLSHLPTDPAELGVWVDRTVAPEWTYDAIANSVVLGTAPPAGSTVLARYPVAVRCE
jgi:hypothetical protein